MAHQPPPTTTNANPVKHGGTLVICAASTVQVGDLFADPELHTPPQPVVIVHPREPRHGMRFITADGGAYEFAPNEMIELAHAA